VKRAVEKGGSCRQVAAQYEVSVSFVVKLMQRWRERGTLTPEPMGGRKPQRLAGQAERVRALVAGDPDLTIDGLRRRLADEGVTVSRSAVGRTLLALGLTRKKRRRGPPSRTGTISPKPAPPGSPAKPR
jgi:transposase